GVGAELLAGGALAVEAVEDRRDLVGEDAGPLVRHDGADGVAVAPHLDADLAVGRAEGQRVVDQVAEYLGQPRADAGYHQMMMLGDVELEARAVGGGGR